MIHELLAPAGNMESLSAAVNAGADAVYLGLKSFSARSFAKNFDKEEFIEAVKYCHLRRVKVYVTMNTLVKDNEVDLFLDDIDFIYKNGADAVLMQDFGMMMLVRKMYPDFNIHASTQFNNSSIDTIKFLYDIGIKRVVVSRELTLDEIKSIDVPIEIECFIHGALCVCYSGLCLMSSMIGSRSANRGSCAYPCRMIYKLYDGNKLIKENYLLSTKELYEGENFNELLNSNITSFKIEGRMKSPEYVYFVTKFYRNLIDGKKKNSKDVDILKILFNRSFTEGHLFNENIINGKSSSHIGLEIGKVTNINNKYIELNVKHIRQGDGIRIGNHGLTVNYLYDDKLNLVNEIYGKCFIKNTFKTKKSDKVFLTSSLYLKRKILNFVDKKVPINIYVKAIAGEKLLIDINGIKTYGEKVDRALNRSTTKEDIYSKISKLGDTPYYIESFKCDIDDNIFVPLSYLNNLRKKKKKNYEESILKIERNIRKEIKFDKLEIPIAHYKTLVTNNLNDLTKDYDRFYTYDYNLFNKYKDKYNIYYIEERCKFKNDNLKGTVRNYFGYPNNSIADYSFNVFNIYTVYFLEQLGYTCVTLSPELKEVECNNLINNFYNKFKFYPNVEVLGKERVKVMTIKDNILNIKEKKEYTLENINKLRFKVIYINGLTYIYNYEETCVNNVNCNIRYNLE